MFCSIRELSSKEVIDIRTGEKLGYIDDVRINTETSEVLALVIYGNPRFFGLFGREDNSEIPCESVRVIGSEVILVDSFSEKCTKNKISGFKNLFDRISNFP